MTEHPIARVVHEGALRITSTQVELKEFIKPSDTRAFQEFDFDKLLRGPASFIRLQSNNNCRLFFHHPQEQQRQEFFEGIISGVPLKIINENWNKIIIEGPKGTVVNVYASRIRESEAIGIGN